MSPLNKMETACAWATFAGFAVSRPTSVQTQGIYKEEGKKRREGRKRKEAKSTGTYNQGVWILLEMWWRYGGDNYITHHILAKLPKYPPGISLLFLLGYRDHVFLILHPIPLCWIILLAT